MNYNNAKNFVRIGFDNPKKVGVYSGVNTELSSSGEGDKLRCDKGNHNFWVNEIYGQGRVYSSLNGFWDIAHHFPHVFT